MTWHGMASRVLAVKRSPDAPQAWDLATACCVSSEMKFCMACSCHCSRQVVLEPRSWAELFHRAGGIPRGVRHAIVMLPPPLNYPRVCTRFHDSCPSADCACNTHISSGPFSHSGYHGMQCDARLSCLGL